MIRTKHVVALASVVSLLVLAAPRAARAADKEMKGGMAHPMMPAEAIQWGDAPPSLPKGAKMAVVQGDPGVAGDLVTVRLKMPKGYTIPPHFHPTDEAVTVLTGSFQMGMGDTIDRKGATVLKPGGWAVMPKTEHHYAIATSPTIVQVHFLGPFLITYVNPDDDPQKNASK